mmetsp:Transcript_7368/g.20463  ORF Transcript_7368/g.20463 Transcript_7368/m.20463 type:complete len:289 (-) Transcript_7368:216-1082(-)
MAWFALPFLGVHVSQMHPINHGLHGKGKIELLHHFVKIGLLAGVQRKDAAVAGHTLGDTGRDQSIQTVLFPNHHVRPGSDVAISKNLCQGVGSERGKLFGVLLLKNGLRNSLGSALDESTAWLVFALFFENVLLARKVRLLGKGGRVVHQVLNEFGTRHGLFKMKNFVLFQCLAGVGVHKVSIVTFFLVDELFGFSSDSIVVAIRCVGGLVGWLVVVILCCSFPFLITIAFVHSFWQGRCYRGIRWQYLEHIAIDFDHSAIRQTHQVLGGVMTLEQLHGASWFGQTKG